MTEKIRRWLAAAAPPWPVAARSFRSPGKEKKPNERGRKKRKKKKKRKRKKRKERKERKKMVWANVLSSVGPRVSFGWVLKMGFDLFPLGFGWARRSESVHFGWV